MYGICVSTKIYGLVHPRTGVVRYVGKCVTPLARRLTNHEYRARSGRAKHPLGDWIRSLQHRGLRPQMLLLEDNVADWQAAERRWIKSLRDEGRRLLNRHPGGNGAHTRAPLDPKLLPLLGVISDARVAEKTALCRETITYHRRSLGIAASSDRSRVKGTFKKRPEGAQQEGASHPLCRAAW